MDTRIVVDVDGSVGSAAALRWVFEKARWLDATVDIVHAWLSPYVGDVSGMAISAVGEDALEQSARAVLERSVRSAGTPPMGVRFNQVLVHGAAASFLLDVAAGADLLVVGSRGRGGCHCGHASRDLRPCWGSTSPAYGRHRRCST